MYLPLTDGSHLLIGFVITRFLTDAIMVSFFLLNHVLKVLTLSGLQQVRPEMVREKNSRSGKCQGILF